MDILKKDIILSWWNEALQKTVETVYDFCQPSMFTKAITAKPGSIFFPCVTESASWQDKANPVF